jgi:hypothetical protein
MFAFAVRGSNTNDGAWVDPADFTQITLKNETLGNADLQAYLGYKIRAAGAGDALRFDFGSGSTAAGMTVGVLCFSGVDSATPIDVSYVGATHYNSFVDAATSAAKAITTVTNGALVLILQNFTAALDTAVAPSGYAEIFNQPTAVTSNNSRHILVYSKSIAVAGAETPAAFGHTDSPADSDTRNFTIALRPSVLPSFTATPAVASQTSSAYTINYTASSDATNIYTGSYLRGATAPTAAQIKAGTNAHGTATEATTGAADSIVLTPSEATKFPEYDLYLVLEGGSGFSQVVALLSEFLDPPANLQFVVVDVPWGAGEESVLQDASPAAVDGDVIVCSTVTSPGSYAVTMAADGVFSFNPGIDTARQTITARFYDVSVGDYSDAAGVTFYVNNQSPLFSGAVELLYEKDVAITALVLATLWTDAESDALTIAFQDTLPTGLSVGAGSMTGTPTVYSDASYTLRATDIAADFTDGEVAIAIGPRLPNVVNTAEAAAIAAVQAVATLTAVVSDRTASATIVLGNVISMNPAANTLVKPSDTVSLVISLGDTSISVPNVVTLDQPTAKTTIEAAGLAVGTVSFVIDLANLYKIVSQSPSSGALADPGDPVNYTVGVLALPIVKGHGRARRR